MKRLREFIRNNRLFMKMFLVMVISIVAVSVLIAFSTIRMSNNLFMETFSITNTKVLNQIKQEFESFSNAVASTTMNVQDNGTIKRLLTREDMNSVEESKSYYGITEQLDRIYTDSLNQANMIVLGNNGRLFNMKYNHWPVTADALINHPITENLQKNPDEILYQFIPASEISNGRDMVVASKALTERSTGNIYGYVYIPIRERDVHAFYEGFTSEGNSVLVMNGQGEIVSSNRSEWIGRRTPHLLSVAEASDVNRKEYRDAEAFDKDYLMMSESLPALDMYVINLIDQEVVVNNLIDTKELVMISVGIVILAVGIVFIISRRMTNSLSRLVGQISNMSKYDFRKPVDEEGGYEARKLGEAFNYMLNELQDHVDILLKTQRQARKAELEALQHQINPHFLYNTLTSVKFMVKEGKKEEAFDTIDALIPLLQNALGNVDETITVEQEAANIEHYILINRMRYGNKIKVNTLISPDCLHYHLPKLVIQPFLENAFFHAFTDKKEGFIQILIAQREDKLVCEVVDTGDGMRMETFRNQKEKRKLFSGIGIRNVHDRIQMLFGEHYGVEIASEWKKGTKVKIVLPLLEGNPKDMTIPINNTKIGPS
ncbi:sensor histidine kinase [Bacillus sp. SB49]|uniref:cache domain-containing sensor histidine kinase n=1 Tax=Bacillaceae TaxID=186817 RepID=UPI0002A4F678|nr:MULTISPECIES: sensor histidine kinase [Bacillaceae]ELK46582.1 two-component sensor histidine kinase [Halobacillus sp. BAB-2008]QHT45494.1 sensor histidine kinase [Bacillus sp. SB49]